MDVSVLCPSIRTANLKSLYDSIGKSFSGKWELIVISPYDLPEELLGMDNVQHIQDYGTPIRCQQLGLLQAKGKYITWAADDGVFLENSLNKAFSLVNGDNTIIMGKYIEGKNNGDMPMQQNEYYNLKNHDASRLKDLPLKEIWMLNVGLVSKKLLEEVGGWDCRYEVCPMSYNDLAIRLQLFGCKFVIQDEVMYTCSHMPGHEGDHAPIHDAQIDHDQPLFEKLWSRPNPESRIKIDINNWKESPARWKRRFG